MTQRALITGATGLLGRQVVRAFDDAGYEAVGTGFSRATDQIRKLDIQDADAVAALLAEVKPQVVVHCAADRQPDSCTANPSAAFSLNATATATLSSLCAKSSTLLIYISTDYVFPGTQGQAPYSTRHTPSPPNTYGETKHAGEKAVLAHPRGGIILRVPVLYGETVPRDNNKESAVNVLIDALWKAKNGEQVKMDDWAIRYPTNTQDVARVIVDLAGLYAPGPLSSDSTPSEQDKTKEELPRILQFSSEDRMTKYEICGVLSDVMALDMGNIVPDGSGGNPGVDGTVRPFDCHLSTEALKGLGVDVRTMNFKDWWKRWVGAYRR